LNSDEIRGIFAQNLKHIRLSQNLSLLSLSDKTGLTHNFINDMETGRKWFSADTLAKLSDALNVEVYQFFVSDEKTKIVPTIPNLYLDNISQYLQKAQETVLEIRQKYPQEEGSGAS
jgi:transcriptional regulator with XRE-family HTH domain